jgi:hypothetical protein
MRTVLKKLTTATLQKATRLIQFLTAGLVLHGSGTSQTVTLLAYSFKILAGC